MKELPTITSKLKATGQLIKTLSPGRDSYMVSYMDPPPCTNCKRQNYKVTNKPYRVKAKVFCSRKCKRSWLETVHPTRRTKLPFEP